MSNSMQPGEFCWNELITSDVARAKEFYKALFGWESQDHDMGEAIYTMFKSGGKDVGGMMSIPAGKENECPPHWMSYVLVEDLDKSVEKAQSLGAVLIVPQKNVGDFGRLALIKDPTGAHLAFWQSLKTC